MLAVHSLQSQPHYFPMEMEALSANHYAAPVTHRKRKADVLPENNERLSKRLSLLNLEQGGTKLYVPVETPTAQPTGTSSSPSDLPTSHEVLDDDDAMQLDDSKHKVYIYNLDDELSSDSEPEDGRLVFLPDIEKHLRKNRLPAHVLARPDADFVGKELVLYRVPSSLTVPEEKDSVRKAILEARARMREQQQHTRSRSDTSAKEDRPFPQTTSSLSHTMLAGDEADEMDID